jgi:hypothetical protein
MISKPKLPKRRRGARSGPSQATAAPPASAAPSAAAPSPAVGQELMVDLQRRRDQLIARVAELQWDLGGLAYEMAVRNQMKVELLVKRAVALQDADAELAEVERIVRTEETGTAGACSRCGAPHSSGATYCWQCGQSLLEQVASDAILRR